ncbi:MAG: 4Fe-4S binding protein [Candidatus Daviesbacteria bacterium]|nr:4Fe-4S binding protein [Candidatus Daviesbacteria bacterium]
MAEDREDRFIEDKKPSFDISSLKSGGFIKQRQKDLFTVRLKAPGGRLPISKMKKIVEVAEKYSGVDFVHISVRQSVEIPYVHIKDFEALRKDLVAVGQEIASCGPRVRVPTACGGCEWNPNGLTNTQGMALEVDRRYFGTECYHKFKTSFSGCPIDCARTREMDLGFQGIVDPIRDEESCILCGICTYACKEGALSLDEEAKKILYDQTKCIYCGDCIRVCPTESWKARKVGWLVRVGGKHGRHPREANEVFYFLPDEEVFLTIEKTLEWYREKGKRGERVGTTLDRVGIESYQASVFPSKA